MKPIQVIDSHTGGEPTRIIVDGGPDLGEGSLAERREIFRDRFDHIRRAVVDEPRGSDVLIGGLLCQPQDSNCSAGVIFFDTAGFLGMCGHGTIGFMVTLRYLKKIELGPHRIETPVGTIRTELADDHTVTVHNVPSYRTQKSVTVEVPDYGRVTGDVVWGGNWFFLVHDCREELNSDRTDHLLQVTRKIREALKDQNISGPDGELIDHIELFGPATRSDCHSRNFVLCPGGDYDRSPCGTGTSAKLACLAADGKLAPGETWQQESIIGSTFTCSYQPTEDGKVLPIIRGSAHVMAESELILEDSDPFRLGIPS